MDKLLNAQNLLNGIAIAIKVNIISFFAAVIVSVGWTYILFGFWDWDYLMYLCIFYSVNISLTLLIKKWYENYLERKENLTCSKPQDPDRRMFDC
ncbi:MAG: hypothetical protein H6Q68_348 [Firmicutes bacterium]|nr:hypothetical protein [Bacillota bacterium]